MKKLLKFLLISFLVIIALFFLTIFVGHKLIFKVPHSTKATISDIKADGFCFGVGCQPEVHTVDEFLTIFSEQLKNHNAVASQLWPDNHVAGAHLVVQSIEKNRAWLFSPAGEITPLSKSEVKELCPIRPRYNVGFAPFSNDSISGMYLALSEVALTNKLEFEKYHYLGTYDLFLTYSHEMFHTDEQLLWNSPEEISNRARRDRMEDRDARMQRRLIIDLLFEANAAETAEQRDSLILQTLSNYIYYSELCPEDLEAARYFDRVEGTAHYYEIIASLYAAYPQQVNSDESLRKALRILAAGNSRAAYGTPGVDSESYTLGAWACMLLDLVQKDNQEWKRTIMEQGELTPLDILLMEFADSELPAPRKATDKDEAELENAIAETENKKVAPAIFRMLYQLVF